MRAAPSAHPPSYSTRPPNLKSGRSHARFTRAFHSGRVFPPAEPERTSSVKAAAASTDKRGKERDGEAEGGSGGGGALSKELLVTLGAGALVVLGLVLLSARKRAA